MLSQGLPFSVWWRRTGRSGVAKRPPRRVSSSNRYAGVRVLRSVPVLHGPIDPQWFFKRFVAMRSPAIVRGGLQAETMAVLDDDDALRRTAGDCELQVEVRSGSESFGRGRKQPMRFGSLLREVAAGATHLYLTTQELPETKGGGEQLVAPPLTRLGGSFPLRPPLVPTLVPQSINLWLGRANGAAGASSGLHHDYHDNLYCLLRGRKRFRLFPPSDVAALYTHGRVARVHPNGRINYEGEPTAPDGRSPDDQRREAAQWARRRQRAAEKALARAEAAEARSEVGAQAAVEAAEEELEGAMDDVMEADAAARRGRRRRRAGGGEAGSSSRAEAGAASELHARSLRLCTAADTEADDAVPPPNFSRVDLGKPAQELRARFPALRRARETRCELGAGDLLYLPCGWFHDVTSLDEHRALNYWFHPPDRAAFAAPYSAASFWEAEWKAASKLLRTAR